MSGWIIRQSLEDQSVYETQEQEIAALRDEATRPRWRKMDSAPKDGTEILVRFPDGDTITRLRWSRADDSWQDRQGHDWRVTKTARWILLPPVEESE